MEKEMEAIKMDFHKRGGQAVDIGGRAMCSTQS